MAKPMDDWECTLGCWAIGGLFAAFAGAALFFAADWTFLQSAFIGAIAFVISGPLITWAFCGAFAPPAIDSTGNAVKTGSKPASKPAAAAPAARVTTPDPEGPKAVLRPTAPLKGQEELAAKKGEWRYTADGDGNGDAAEAGTPPETLEAPRDGGPDDLKRLKGVGPKLEATLHELGFYHFDQIARWTDAEVAWVDQRLKFKGRIERDGWIEQAKALAAEGRT